MLKIGDVAPGWDLLNQRSELVTLGEHRGHRVLLYFYPKADTPGCTEQSCLLRDIAANIGDTAIVGVSPDKPAKQAKFDAKHSLGFTLLSDLEHVLAEAYGVWQEKMLYGRSYMGIVRSAFLIDENGTIEQAWYKISPKDTPTRLLAALGVFT
jgi:thioredoxin-dependent peroxiredoxin